MLHQIVLGGNQHRAAEGIQICVMQLIWHSINLVRRVQVDVPDEIQKDIISIQSWRILHSLV